MQIGAVTTTIGATDEEQDEKEQNHDEGDDAKDFDPARCAGVGGGGQVRHVHVLLWETDDANLLSPAYVKSGCISSLWGHV